MWKSWIVLASVVALGTGAGADLKPESAQSYIPFEGTPSQWHDGFQRFDYVMDGQTMAIAPFSRPADEQFGIGGPPEGQRRCVVVCPRHPAPGNPWSWRGCYWDHQPQTEIELLKRGFHIAYISADATHPPDKYWDAWYAYLTDKHGLSPKPGFIGMSRGGQFALRWATAHPDKVSGIYADNPGGDDDIFRGLPSLARNDVPLFLLCGTNDPLLPHYAGAFEAIYEQFGGRVSMMLKDGAGHHPHSLNDPKPLADFLEASAQEKPAAVPEFVGTNPFSRSTYYSLASTYAWFPQDGYYIKRRGAAFTECYDQYSLSMGFEVAVTVIVPKKTAPEKPWVFRSSYVPRDAAVDQALLSHGFHIVVGPVGYNADGPVLSEWNKLYAYLTEHGFSRKPTLEGEGGGAGAVYGWAVENPDKVACVFAEHPVMHAAGVQTQPIDRLATLAKSGVALMHVQGDSEPTLAEEQREVEKRYRALGGGITILRAEDEQLSQENVKAAVAFILSHN